MRKHLYAKEHLSFYFLHIPCDSLAFRNLARSRYLYIFLPKCKHIVWYKGLKARIKLEYFASSSLFRHQTFSSPSPCRLASAEFACCRESNFPFIFCSLNLFFPSWRFLWCTQTTESLFFCHSHCIIGDLRSRHHLHSLLTYMGELLLYVHNQALSLSLLVFSRWRATRIISS